MEKNDSPVKQSTLEKKGYVDRISGQLKIKPFVIIGTQRTGSTMIAGTLHQHPDINCGGEWTIKISPLKRISQVKAGLSGQFENLSEPHISMMSKKKAIAIGFRLLFSSSPKWFIFPQYNLANIWERLDGFLEFFRQNPDIKIVHMVRNDQLAWLASLFMAKSSNSYSSKKYPEDLKVNIPVKEAVKRVRAKIELEKKIRTLQLHNPCFEIKYEEILTGREAGIKKLFAFLDVPVPDLIPESPIQKQQHKPISEVIINFDDIRQAISEL